MFPMVLTAASILSVTSVSMSCGAAPGCTVVIVTTGNSTFGKRSTPRREYPARPTTTMRSESTVAKTGRRTQTSASHCMGYSVTREPSFSGGRGSTMTTSPSTTSDRMATFPSRSAPTRTTFSTANPSFTK